MMLAEERMTMSHHIWPVILAFCLLGSVSCIEAPTPRGQPGLPDFKDDDGGVSLVDGGSPSLPDSDLEPSDDPSGDSGGDTGAGGGPNNAPDSGPQPAPDTSMTSPDMGPAPTPGTCDPNFLGPFCTGDDKHKRIIGFDDTPAKANPTPDEVRKYSFDALNYIRAMTCLPPLKIDTCLNQIAESALAANAGHGYFLQNCMNSAYNYGKSCKCGWAQENIGASYGTGRTWKDGVQNPLCGMMTEPKGKGHRGNIESKTWTRIGIGIKFSSSGASWYHEFGY
jgi:hypothetical protein